MERLVSPLADSLLGRVDGGARDPSRATVELLGGGSARRPGGPLTLRVHLPSARSRGPRLFRHGVLRGRRGSNRRWSARTAAPVSSDRLPPCSCRIPLADGRSLSGGPLAVRRERSDLPADVEGERVVSRGEASAARAARRCPAFPFHCPERLLHGRDRLFLPSRAALLPPGPAYVSLEARVRLRHRRHLHGWSMAEGQQCHVWSRLHRVGRSRGLAKPVVPRADALEIGRQGLSCVHRGGLLGRLGDRHCHVFPFRSREDCRFGGCAELHRGEVSRQDQRRSRRELLALAALRPTGRGRTKALAGALLRWRLFLEGGLGVHSKRSLGARDERALRVLSILRQSAVAGECLGLRRAQ